MRIGEPARKHGFADEHIDHGIRNGICWVAMADDLTMVIDPARNGEFLEIAVLDIDGDDPVAIHAMALRPEFHRLTDEGKRP